MKKIILSGGWSYGNLGDEAILMSSVRLLHEKYPNHSIVVLLYRHCETEKYLKAFDYIQIDQSLHSLMYGIKQEKMDFGGNFVEELTHPILRRLNHQLEPIRNKHTLKRFLQSLSSYFDNFKEVKSHFAKLCESAELYVMSGGGYLNDWSEMIISKYLEVLIAKEKHLKTYMIGQTVGPFTEYSMKVYCHILDNIDGAFFRDTESIKDTKALGHNCLEEVVPDLALAEETVCEKGNYVAFVPFLTDLNQHMDDIIKNLESIVRDSGCKVVITVSQQWSWCIQIATSFYIAMRSRGLDVKLVIPEDYKELEHILSAAQFVFSQNLHGLILAYRGHTPIVCLNDRRKFVSFMKTIDQKENLIAPSKITGDNLYECYKQKEKFNFDNCKIFRQQISDAINETLI